jgi:hypothetical protein
MNTINVKAKSMRAAAFAMSCLIAMLPTSPAMAFGSPVKMAPPALIQWLYMGSAGYQGSGAKQSTTPAAGSGSTPAFAQKVKM